MPQVPCDTTETGCISPKSRHEETEQMSAETPPAPKAVRLAGLPDEISVKEIAAARGVSEAAVRNWMKLPAWPASVGKRGRTHLYPNTGVAECLADNEAAARIDVSKLGEDPDERVTLPIIADRTGLPAGTVSAYPTLYGPGSSDPFPGGDSLGRRRVGDVAAWLSRRSRRGGIRAVAAAPTEVTRQAAASAAKFSEDEIDINGVQAATGLSREAAKSLLRRDELAARQMLDRAALPGRSDKKTLTEKRSRGRPHCVTDSELHFLYPSYLSTANTVRLE